MTESVSCKRGGVLKLGRRSLCTRQWTFLYKSRGVLLVGRGSALTDDIVEQHPKGIEIPVPISEGQAKPHLDIGTKKVACGGRWQVCVQVNLTLRGFIFGKLPLFLPFLVFVYGCSQSAVWSNESDAIVGLMVSGY